jgi:hypothetical protein
MMVLKPIHLKDNRHLTRLKRLPALQEHQSSTEMVIWVAQVLFHLGLLHILNSLSLSGPPEVCSYLTVRDDGLFCDACFGAVSI